MASFCESCGSPLEEGALFCTVCGAKVDDDIVEAEQEPEAVVEALEPVAIEDVKTVEDEVEPPEPVMISEIVPPEPAPPVQPVEVHQVIPAAAAYEAPTTPESPAVPTEPPQPVQPVQPSVQVSTDSVAKSVTPDPALNTRSRTPIFAVVAVVVLACAAIVIWLVVGGKAPKKVDTKQPGVTASAKTSDEKQNPQEPDPKASSNVATPEETAGPSEEIARLRTEVTKILSDVSAAGWTDAICKKELPYLSALTDKVKDLKREDLSRYWKSLSLFIQACNAATRKDRANSKAYLTKATDELASIPIDSLSLDATLKGDVFGSIGSYKSLANDIGLPADYVACQKLSQLKKELDKL